MVQNRPEGAMPGSQSWNCWVGSPTAPTVNRSIQTKAKAPCRNRFAVSTNVPSMNRMSASKSHSEPSVPTALPRISAAAIVPLKSVIVAISNPGAGIPTWMIGSCGTRLKSAAKPPGIGFGTPVPGFAAAAKAGRPTLAPTAAPAVRCKRTLREMRAIVSLGAILLPPRVRSQPRRRRRGRASLLQPRIAVRFVALLPSRAVRLLGVEFDHEAMLGPVGIDPERADVVVHDRCGEAVRPGPAQELPLPLAARMRHREGLGEVRGARLSAPVARERSQGIEGDRVARGKVVSHAVDRPAGCGEVEEGLG